MQISLTSIVFTLSAAIFSIFKIEMDARSELLIGAPNVAMIFMQQFSCTCGEDKYPPRGVVGVLLKLTAVMIQ